MDDQYLEELFRYLGAIARIDRGLNDSEVRAVEEQYGFHFPPDLRTVLQYGLPVDEERADFRQTRFPNWRSANPEAILWRLAGPLEGILFDIERNDFWAESWGERPASLPEALTFARELIEDSPALIPVYSHRYIPAEPSREGNPVFSVMQTDIIYYGFDLPWYFHNEFGVPLPAWVRTQPRAISLWTEITEWNESGT